MPWYAVVYVALIVFVLALICVLFLLITEEISFGELIRTTSNH